MDWDTYIMDVRTVNFKRKKRKLLLTKGGEEEETVVHRLKKLNIEEKIRNENVVIWY